MINDFALADCVWVVTSGGVAIDHAARIPISRAKDAREMGHPISTRWQGEVALERFAGIQQDRYRAFIHQFHAHHFLEAAGFAARAGGADLLDKEFV